MSKHKEIHEATNPELVAILNEMYKCFPSLNFEVDIEIIRPDGSGTIKAPSEAVYDKELFEKLMSEIAKRLELLEKYQKEDVRIESDDDIFHKLLMQISEIDDLYISFESAQDGEYYDAGDASDFNEGNIDSESIDRIRIERVVDAGEHASYDEDDGFDEPF